MLVLAAEASARLIYVLDEVLTRRLGIAYKITNNTDYFLKSQSIRLNYGKEVIEGVFNIPAHGLLFESTIKPLSVQTKKDKDWQYVCFEKSFETQPDVKQVTGHITFDILAATFYLISRYEEYLPAKRDAHLRFLSRQSLAFKAGFLDFPLVDFWAQRLGFLLKEHYPGLSLSTPHFQQYNTIDIDFAFKYKYKSRLGLLKKLAGSMLRFKPDLKTILPPKEDPYDTYKYMLRTASAKDVPSCFFLLLADYGVQDNNHSPLLPEIQSLYRIISESTECGIHPSYKSGIDKETFKKEIQLFEHIIGEAPKKARYHFLKLRFPESLRALVQAEITDDYTLCYAETSGFRASTSIPIQAFDLIENKTLPLTLHSPCLMDVGLKEYQQLKASEAIAKIKQLKETVKQVNGEFISIWHNSSFDAAAGWQAWDKVYESLFE